MVDTPRKTFPELQALTAPVVDSDVLAVYRSPGPAKRTTASVLGTYVNTVIGTPFTRTLLATANNSAFLVALGQIASSFVNFLQSGTGAVTRTVEGRLKDTIHAKDFGALGGGANDTAAIQAALTYAGTRAPATVFCNDVQYTTDELNVPANVTLFCNLKIRTAATVGSEKNIVRVNPGCTVIGRLEGSNTTATEVVERGIYPAVNSCHDVTLDVEITKTTVGVQASDISDLTLPPRRWRGRIVCNSIAAFIGGSNGYGLNGTLCDSNLIVITTSVPRHGLYLAAGASNNYIEIHDDGSRFAPIDIASDPGQPECFGNSIIAFVRNHLGNYTGLNCVGGFFKGACRGNKLELHISDSAALYSAFQFLATNTTTYPTDNDVTVYFDGDISGTAVVELMSGGNNQINLYGAGAKTGGGLGVPIYVGRNDSITPASPPAYAAVIGEVNYRCGSGFTNAVAVVTNYAKTLLGYGSIVVSGYSGDPVVVSGSPVLEGWINQARATFDVSGVAAGGTFDVVVTHDKIASFKNVLAGSVVNIGGTKTPNNLITVSASTTTTVQFTNLDSVTARFVGSVVIQGY
jgi:hypothetical protein